MSAPPRPLTAIFTKRPVPGRVKTRLVPPLTPAAAARLSEAMLRDTVERLAPLEPLLCFAPAEEESWFREAFPDLELAAQRGEELGERLAHAFAAGLARAPTMVVVGSDQPLLGVGDVRAAHAALVGGADVVLQPDLGGGYTLVGLTRPFPALFTGVAMSAPSMCAATIELAERAGRRVELLSPGLDVDTPTDLERLRAALARPRSDPPRRTCAMLQELSP